MIISRIYNKLSKEQKENLAFGLAFGLAVGLVYGLAVGLAVGLAAGLAFGLVYGLAVGLAVGLAFGLVYGLVYGLAVGLAVGLAFGLVYGLAFGLAVGLFPINILTIIIFIVLIELFYWLSPKEKLKKNQSLTKFVIIRKLEAILEVCMLLGIYPYIYWIDNYFDKIPFEEIIKWIGYIGLGIVGLGILLGLVYLWYKLNEVKYK